MDSAELAHVAACQAGRLDDFDPLYVRHVDAIYKYLSRRTLDREAAEDITSITFMKALEKIRSFDPAKGELRAWLYRIARNALIDHYRDPSRRTVDIENVWDLASDEVASLAAERSIDAAKVHKALQALKPAQREIVMLRVWEGLSYKEIADITGKTEGNCKVLFSRAVADLRKDLPAFLLLLLLPTTLSL